MQVWGISRRLCTIQFRYNPVLFSCLERVLQTGGCLFVFPSYSLWMKQMGCRNTCHDGHYELFQNLDLTYQQLNLFLFSLVCRFCQYNLTGELRLD